MPDRVTLDDDWSFPAPPEPDPRDEQPFDSVRAFRKAHAVAGKVRQATEPEG